MSDGLKRRAAEAALDFVEDGMRLGLGTGTTCNFFLEMLGERVRRGLKIVGVPTSKRTRSLARKHGVPLTTLDKIPELDLDIDGADEIGPKLTVVKGGGGALLREKIVASASQRTIVIADESKRVRSLGAFPLPIEIVKFGRAATVRAIDEAARGLGLTAAIAVRMQGDKTFRTDSGNLVVDASFGRIPDPEALADRLARIPGVVEHGLFIDLVDLAIIATPKGVMRVTA
jgi:ribose 5-phosphate isomerase A